MNILSPSIKLVLCFAILQFVVCPSKLLSQVKEFTLGNGIHVVVNPVKEVDDVGVETIYEVGFIDEPKSMVQSSHLLEHLVCYAAGAGYEQKEAMKWLNSVGTANAETMPDWTHYDYSVPADKLEEVFKIEAARLLQTGFDQSLINAEAKRVYQETDFVERNPAAGMMKHAFMALSHSWKFQSETALVRGGLEDMDPMKVLEFYKQTYRPDNLVVFITGNTSVEAVKVLAEKHLSGIKNTEDKASSAVDWDNVPAKSKVGWDSKHSAVCVAWNPPKKKEDQVLLASVGTFAMQKLAQNKTIKDKCTICFCSNSTWHVGDLPFFVYGMAKEGESLDDIEKLITTEFEKEVKQILKNQFAMIRSIGMNYEFQLKPMAWARLEQGKKMLVQMGRPEKMAIQMVLTQDALNRGVARRFLGDDAEAMIKLLKSVEQEDLQAIVDSVMTEKNRHVVQVVPGS